MEAQELRIGNYAMGNKPFAVDANHIAMAYNHEIAQNGHERFKSIPLTEDWLIRLPKGFEYPDWIKFVHDLQNWYYYNNNKIELIFDK